MPLFSTKRKISDAENKLRVLLCLEALGMATQEELWPFVAQLELMEYIPFCMFVDELRVDGAVDVGQHALAGVLYLTPAGRQQLLLFGSKVPHADRERILQAAPAYAQKLRARKQVHAAYELSQGGVYRARLTVQEGDEPTLLLRLASTEQTLVEKSVKGFAVHAAQVLDLLYSLPFEPAEAASLEMTRPVLCAVGGREHAAVANVQDKRVQYTLQLLLPTAQLAWGWAQTVEEAGAALAEQLTALMEGTDV